MVDAAEKVFLAELAESMTIDPLVCSTPGTTIVSDDKLGGSRSAAIYRIDDCVAKHTIVCCDPALAATLGEFVIGSQPLEIAAMNDFAVSQGAEPRGGSTEHILMQDLIPPNAPICRGHLIPLGHHGDHVVDKIAELQAGCSPEDVRQSDFRLGGLDPYLIGWELHGKLMGVGGARVHDQRPALFDIGVLTHGEVRGQGLGGFLIAAVTGAVVAAGSVPLYRHDLVNGRSPRIVARLGFTEVMETKKFRWPLS